MDEQKKKTVRRISGRLTDTIRETDIPANQSVFTPRRTVRPNRTGGETMQAQGSAREQKSGRQAQAAAVPGSEKYQGQTAGMPQKEARTAQAGAAPRREEKQLQIFVPQHKAVEPQQESSAPLKSEAVQKRPETAQSENGNAKIIHPERRVRLVRQETEAGQERPIRPEAETGEHPAAEQEGRPVRPERREHAAAPTPVPATHTGKRRREQENEAKMRSLWSVLGVLVVLLVAAIIYEIVLGHGIRQTGSERMAQKKQEKIENVIEILDDTADVQTELQADAQTEVQTETQTDVQTEIQTETETE